MVVFEDRENRSTRGKPLGAEKRKEPTNSTHIWRRIWASNPDHIGGRRVLSPLRHPRTRHRGTLSTLNISFEEMIVTLAGQSRWFSRMCTWQFSAIFNGIRIHDRNGPFISQPHFIKFLSLSIPFTGTREPNKFTYLYLSGFMTQMVRALNRHRTGHGIESLGRELKFYRCTYETVAEIVQ